MNSTTIRSRLFVRGTSVAFALAAIAGSAFAQAGSLTYASGLLHQPVGATSSMSVDGRRLTACCLGSSGEDGVAVDFHSTRGGMVSVDMTPVFQAASTGGEIKIRHKGWDGLIYGTHRAIATFSDGTTTDVTEECDFSALGPVHIEVTCVSSTGVETVFIRESPTLASTGHMVHPPGTPPMWTFGAGKASMQLMLTTVRRTSSPCDMTFPSNTGGVFTVPDVVSVSYRPICIVAPCPGDGTQLGSMEVLSNVPQIELSDAALDWSWGSTSSTTLNPGSGHTGGGMLIWGSGGGGGAGGFLGAHLSEEDGGDLDGDGLPDRVIRASNIGSSGQDGVEIDIPGGADGLSRRWGNGHVTLMKAYDDGGTEMRVTTTIDPLTCTYSISPDFSGMGSSDFAVTLRDRFGNPLVNEITLPAGDDFTITSCNPLQDVTTECRKNGYVMAADYNYRVSIPEQTCTLPDGTPVSGVASITFRPTFIVDAMGPIVRSTLTSGDGQDIVVGDVHILPPIERVHVSGFLHESVDGATFDPVVGRSLTVRKQGEGQKDFVDLRCPTTQGAMVDVDISSLMGPPSTTPTEVVATMACATGQHIKSAKLFVRRMPGAPLVEGVDLSDLDPMEVLVECVNVQGFVVNSHTSAFDLVTFTNGAPYGLGEQAAHGMGSGKASFSDLSIMITLDKASPLLFDTGVFVPDVWAVRFTPIMCITHPCPGDITGVSSIRVSGQGLDEVTVSNAALDWSFGASNGCSSCVPITGTGRVYLFGGQGSSATEMMNGDLDGDGVSDPIVRGSALGVGAEAVVGVFMPPHGGDSALRSKRCPDCPPGHVTLIKFHDQEGSEARLTTTENPLAGSMSFTPDFSSIGSPECVVECTDDAGVVIASSILPAGASVSSCCPPPYEGIPPECVRGNHFPTVKIELRFHESHMVSMGGGLPPIPGVRAISMRPTTDSFEWKVEEGESWVISSSTGDVDVGAVRLLPAPPTGPVCDSIDFNNDSLFPDTTDIDDFLSVFSGGPCSTGTCSDIDFNNDSLFPDTTDIDSLLSVFSGGPCF